MPIKGMTDREYVTRVGKIRLGEKRISRNGKEYPAATDYFVCPAGGSGNLWRKADHFGYCVSE